MSVNSVNWGPKGGINTKSYVLAMAQDNITKFPQILPGHALGGVSQNLIDALLVARVYYENGENVTRFEVSRAAEETHREYTLGYPAGILSTPALDMATYKPGCAKDFFALYTCAEAQFEHFVVFTNARLNPPVETGEFTQIDEQTSIDQQSAMFIERRLMKFRLFGSRLYSASAATAQVLALTIQDPVCKSCSGGLFDNGIVFLSDSTPAAPNALITEDRFGTYATPVVAATSTYFATAAVEVGDVVILGLSDDSDPATGAAGAVRLSLDGGVTWFSPLSATAPAVPIYGLAVFDNAYYAVGGGGEIWKSEDVVNWEQITHTATTAALTAISVDEDNQRAYISGLASTLLVIENNAVIDLSASLAAAGLAPGTALYAVAVFDDDFVAVGGAGGVYYETQDGFTNISAVSLAGLLTDVRVILGSKYRQVVGMGTSIVMRDLLSRMNYSAVALRFNQTVTGAIRAGAMGYGPHGDNLFILGDVTGDVYVLAPAVNVF